MKKLKIVVAILMSISTSAKSVPLDPYIGKWAEISEGCNDKDGQGAIYFSKNPQGFEFEGYETHGKVESVTDKGDSLRIVTKSIGDHDDLTNGEISVFSVDKIRVYNNIFKYVKFDQKDAIYIKCAE